MNSIVNSIASEYLRTDLPAFKAGDRITVHYKIKEDGSIGQVIMPEVNNPAQESKGYKLTLDILEFIDKEKGALIRSETNKRKYN